MTTGCAALRRLLPATVLTALLTSACVWNTRVSDDPPPLPESISAVEDLFLGEPRSDTLICLEDRCQRRFHLVVQQAGELEVTVRLSQEREQGTLQVLLGDPDANLLEQRSSQDGPTISLRHTVNPGIHYVVLKAVGEKIPYEVAAHLTPSDPAAPDPALKDHASLKPPPLLSPDRDGEKRARAEQAAFPASAPPNVECGPLEALPARHGPHWTYHGPEGPGTWGELPGYEACAVGQEQSPINISTADLVPDGAPLAFERYDRAIPLTLKNNGHTLEVGYEGERGEDHPRIVYEGKTYYLLQLHLHSTSEHTLDGEEAIMEVHFVHKAEDGALAVVAVLFDDGTPSGAVQTLLDNEPGVGQFWECSESLQLDAILPSTRGFFHYAGSLTTPPCSEGLNWFVMSSRQTASIGQAGAYLGLFQAQKTNRPVQPLNGRQVELHSPSEQ